MKSQKFLNQNIVQIEIQEATSILSKWNIWKRQKMFYKRGVYN